MCSSPWETCKLGRWEQIIAFFNKKKEEFRFKEKLPGSFPIYQVHTAAARWRKRRPTPRPGKWWRRRSCKNQFPVVPWGPACAHISPVCSTSLLVPGRRKRCAFIRKGLRYVAFLLVFPTSHLWECFYGLKCR